VSPRPPGRVDPVDPDAVLREAEMVADRETVDGAYRDLAAAISSRLAHEVPVVMAVMLGGLIPTGRLLSLLEFPLEVDYVHASRYRDGTRGRELRWIAGPSRDLAGRTVLVVDDILDEGHTLAAVLDRCRSAGAREVLSTVLVHKRHSRGSVLARADFTGLETGDRYLFGCGMDYRGYLRNLPAIYALSTDHGAGGLRAPSARVAP
jgi:hypoxanthine phosphoribosyltransferase